MQVSAPMMPQSSAPATPCKVRPLRSENGRRDASAPMRVLYSAFELNGTANSLLVLSRGWKSPRYVYPERVGAVPTTHAQAASTANAAWAAL